MKMSVMWIAAACFALCLWTACLASSLPFVKVNPDNQFFVDSYGRVVIFHGVNAVYKAPPFAPITDHFDPQNSMADVDLANLRAWGFNFVRLYTAWPGVNPAEGAVNSTYLDTLSSLVDRMEQHGIYTLLDNHQDVISRYFCGEGFPDWLAAKKKGSFAPFPAPLKFNMDIDPSTGYPALDACLAHEFAEYYLTEAVQKTFEMLLTNEFGAQEAFADFWKAVATRFVGRAGVVGYEIINEPPTPDVLMVPLLGYVDSKYLDPMYKRIHAAVREVDDEHIIFFEPMVFDISWSGLPAGPGGAAYNDRQVYSYHVYCPLVNSRGEPDVGAVCRFTDDELIAMRVAEAKHKKFGGMMITEFGALSNATTAIEEIGRVTAAADAHMQGWAYWMFKRFADYTTAANPPTTESFYDQNGALEVDKVRGLSRTYAPLIAGVPTHWMFDTETAAFEIEFTLDTKIQAPTVLYANLEMWYPKGLEISVLPAGALEWSSTEVNYYEFVPSSGAVSGTTVTIQVTSKA
jgi:endoglycosylceramidase